MNRAETLERVRRRNDPWDIVVIGGGATGVGCALDAASRGFDVLLLDQHDLGKGTSSRSTKLIHGGVRYLRQGDLRLVRESLRERGLLLRNAGHVVHQQAFVIPCYSVWQRIFYGAGLKLYDLLAGEHSLGRSTMLSKAETVERLPGIETSGLNGGVLYHDGQFDDARLLIDMARTADALGAALLNYTAVTALAKDANGEIAGVAARDAETGEEFIIAARVVINAAGVFCDAIGTMSDTDAQPVLTFSQGIHIVVKGEVLAGNDAMMIPKTSDGRILFCIPWHGHTLIGTTDTPVATADLEPSALEAEIDFVLETVRTYFAKKVGRGDILSVFAGIRPLVRRDANTKTSAISRGHDLFVDGSGLITITGGKWTTYRKMAEDAVDKAIEVGGFDHRPSITATLPIKQAAGDSEETPERLHPDLPYTIEDVVRSVREEMARSVEDVLARRTRVLFLNAKAAVEIAPQVAEIMEAEMGKDNIWIDDQLAGFRKTALSYSAYSVETASSP